MDDNSHYSALLEKMLNAGGCRREHFQVVSAGVNAYPNSLVAERLKEVIENPLYQPDVVIRAYSFNSNFENLPRLEGAARQQFLNRVRWKSLVRRSAIYNFFIEDLFRELAYYKLRHILMAGSLSTIEGNGDLDVNRFNAGLDQSLQLAAATPCAAGSAGAGRAGRSQGLRHAPVPESDAGFRRRAQRAGGQHDRRHARPRPDSHVHGSGAPHTPRDTS